MSIDNLGLTKIYSKFVLMQKEKVQVEDPTNSQKAKKGTNPFIKLMDEQELIAKAVKNNQPLSSLKGIKFVRPL